MRAVDRDCLDLNNRATCPARSVEPITLCSAVHAFARAMVSIAPRRGSFYLLTLPLPLAASRPARDRPSLGHLGRVYIEPRDGAAFRQSASPSAS